MSMIPSFESHAAAIVDALVAVDKAAAKSRDAIAFAMQAYIDSAYAAGCDKEEATVTAIGAEVRTCQTFVDAVASGLLESKTCTEYAQGAMRAYFHGVTWAPTLKNNPDMALPWSKKKAAPAAAKKGARQTAGKVDTPAPAGTIHAAPTTAQECRDHVRDVAIQLQRWANENMLKLDLQTREVIERFRASVEKLPTDKAPF